MLEKGVLLHLRTVACGDVIRDGHVVPVLVEAQSSRASLRIAGNELPDSPRRRPVIGGNTPILLDIAESVLYQSHGKPDRLVP